MKGACIIFILLFGINARAQETKTLEQCESEFLKSNLFLLASQYNIDVANAITIQESLWENPILTGELNLINPTKGHVLDIGQKGQKALAIQQIVYLGGKKANQIAYAKSNEQIAKLELEELLRNLKYELRTSFYSLYFNDIKLESFENQISQIDSLASSYAVQVRKGNIPMKDLVRLQTLLLEFKNNRVTILNENADLQLELALLMNSDSLLTPISSSSALEKYFGHPILTQELIYDLALETRPDYQLSKGIINSNELNINWQKSLVKPDVILGLSYDQRGGAFVNQINATLAMSLPLWNKNQGNIKLAQALKSQSVMDSKRIANQINTETKMAYRKWLLAKTNYSNVSENDLNNLRIVYDGTLYNFRKSNISLLEFTDFMETYNQTIGQFSNLKKEVVIAAEELNKTINKNIF